MIDRDHPVGDSAGDEEDDNTKEGPGSCGTHGVVVVERMLVERRRYEAPYGRRPSKAHFQCACMAQRKYRSLYHSVVI